jgi:MFS family permease
VSDTNFSNTEPPVGRDRPRLAALLGLSLAQCLGSFGQITMATLSGIVGSMLTPAAEFATLPVTTGILGIASATWPLARLRERHGSRSVFGGGCIWAALGASVAAASIAGGSFIGFCLGTFMMGNNMAVIAQYRFVAAELVPGGMVSRAISAVMVGTLLAAVVAPWIALEYRDLLAVDFAGSFAVLVAVFVATAVLVTALPLRDDGNQAGRKHAGPPLGATLKRPPVQLAIIAAAGGFGIMSLIMTATPISMHVMDEHSAAVTAGVIRAHILAMFAPSLISGWLVEKLGIPRMLWIGLALQLACIGIAASGSEVWQYRAALIALGAGWNFLFVAGTTLLMLACETAEKPKMQGFNDLVMFCTMGLASLSAGGLLYSVGWQWTNLVTLVLLCLIAAAILRASSQIRDLHRTPYAQPASSSEHIT